MVIDDEMPGMRAADDAPDESGQGRRHQRAWSRAGSGLWRDRPCLQKSQLCGCSDPEELNEEEPEQRRRRRSPTAAKRQDSVMPS